ncbi:hypothetical protein WR25_13123 isoform D [Diploscapter pachys]|nr:hypothetical protein WR25_13123 isoform D [Diploscapter pachys]
MYHNNLAPLGKISDKINSIESVGKISIKPGHTVGEVFWNFQVDPLVYEPPFVFSLEIMKSVINDENLATVLNTSYDVVLVDEIFMSMQAAVALKLKQKFGSRIGIFATTDVNVLFTQYKGLGRNPITETNFYTSHFDMYDVNVERFWWRLKSFITHLKEIYIHYVNDYHMKGAGELLEISSSFDEIFGNSLFTLMEFPYNFGYPVTKSSNLFHIMHFCPESKLLSEDYLKFIEDPTYEAVIYVAFGSFTDWTVAPNGTIEKFVNALNDLEEYKIIWSYNGPSVSHLVKSHIMVTSWAPQHGILSHKKVQAFFTHGGQKSLKEGICTATPLLFFPLFSDQPKNTANAILMGIAEAVNKFNFTSEVISEKLRIILRTKSYAERMEKFRSIFIDRPVHPLEEAAHFISKLVKNSGFKDNFFRIKINSISIYDLHVICMMLIFIVMPIVCIL